MRVLKPKRELIPRWEMPADPVKAVFWFILWSLKVLVRFFYIPILAGVIYESILNHLVGGVVTLLVGLVVWAGIAVALFLFNIGSTVSQGISDSNRIQQGHPVWGTGNPQRSPYSREPDGRIVEGSITDLEEERKKRRGGD
jgi:hypothetical protein